MNITYTQLDTALSHFLASIQAFDFYLHDLFYNLHNTGLRFCEIFELDRWTYNADNNIICNTAKDSNSRTFTSSDLTFPFVQSIINDTFLYNTCKYSTTILYFKRYFEFYNLKVGGKKILTHIFRHYKAKQLHEFGYSDVEIQNYIGEKSLSNAQNYINSILYYDVH